MANWIPIAPVDDCPPGASLETVAADRIVALYNVAGEFFALDGVCSHQGGPLGKGQLCGHIVTCPWHGWQFDVRDGQNEISPKIRQPRFDLRIEDGQVLVDLDSC